MVAPVTVHPVETQELVTKDAWGQIWPVYRKTRQRRTQVKPIDRPLPYDFSEASVKIKGGNNSSGPMLTTTETALYTVRSRAQTLARNRAYAKFRDACVSGRSVVLEDSGFSRVEMGMNLATASMTASLMSDTRMRVGKVVSIAGIATLLDRFAKAIRNAQHQKAVRLLGKRLPASLDKEFKSMKRAGKLRDFSRDISQEYLMLHFAWSPLLGDMFGLLQQLQDGYSLQPYKVKVRGGARYAATSGSGEIRTAGKGRSSVTMAAQAVVSNEILFVLNRTGLVNPLTIAWDLVPFSFVAGWFANFEACLAAPTDFVGITLSGYSETLYDTSECTRWAWVKNSFTNNIKSYTVQEGQLTTMKRTTPTMPAMPKLVALVPVGSWRRGLAQISLLTLFGISPSQKTRNSPSL